MFENEDQIIYYIERILNIEVHYYKKALIKISNQKNFLKSYIILTINGLIIIDSNLKNIEVNCNLFPTNNKDLEKCTNDIIFSYVFLKKVTFFSIKDQIFNGQENNFVTKKSKNKVKDNLNSFNFEPNIIKMHFYVDLHDLPLHLSKDDTRQFSIDKELTIISDFSLEIVEEVLKIKSLSELVNNYEQEEVKLEIQNLILCSQTENQVLSDFVKAKNLCLFSNEFVDEFEISDKCLSSKLKFYLNKSFENFENSNNSMNRTISCETSNDKDCKFQIGNKFPLCCFNLCYTLKFNDESCSNSNVFIDKDKKKSINKIHNLNLKKFENEEEEVNDDQSLISNDKENNNFQIGKIALLIFNSSHESLKQKAMSLVNSKRDIELNYLKIEQSKSQVQYINYIKKTGVFSSSFNIKDHETFTIICESTFNNFENTNSNKASNVNLAKVNTYEELYHNLTSNKINQTIKKEMIKRIINFKLQKSINMKAQRNLDQEIKIFKNSIITVKKIKNIDVGIVVEFDENLDNKDSNIINDKKYLAYLEILFKDYELLLNSISDECLIYNSVSEIYSNSLNLNRSDIISIIKSNPTQNSIPKIYVIKVIGMIETLFKSTILLYKKSILKNEEIDFLKFILKKLRKYKKDLGFEDEDDNKTEEPKERQNDTVLANQNILKNRNAIKTQNINLVEVENKKDSNLDKSIDLLKEYIDAVENMFSGKVESHNKTSLQVEKNTKHKIWNFVAVIFELFLSVNFKMKTSTDTFYTIYGISLKNLPFKISDYYKNNDEFGGMIGLFSEMINPGSNLGNKELFTENSFYLNLVKRQIKSLLNFQLYSNKEMLTIEINFYSSIKNSISFFSYNKLFIFYLLSHNILQDILNIPNKDTFYDLLGLVIKTSPSYELIRGIIINFTLIECKVETKYEENSEFHEKHIIPSIIKVLNSNSNDEIIKESLLYILVISKLSNTLKRLLFKTYLDNLLTISINYVDVKYILISIIEEFLSLIKENFDVFIESKTSLNLFKIIFNNLLMPNILENSKLQSNNNNNISKLTFNQNSSILIKLFLIKPSSIRELINKNFQFEILLFYLEKTNFEIKFLMNIKDKFKSKQNKSKIINPLIKLYLKAKEMKDNYKSIYSFTDIIELIHPDLLYIKIFNIMKHKINCYSVINSLLSRNIEVKERLTYKKLTYTFIKNEFSFIEGTFIFLYLFGYKYIEKKLISKNVNGKNDEDKFKLNIRENVITTSANNIILTKQQKEHFSSYLTSFADFIEEILTITIEKNNSPKNSTKIKIKELATYEFCSEIFSSIEQTVEELKENIDSYKYDFDEFGAKLIEILKRITNLISNKYSVNE